MSGSAPLRVIVRGIGDVGSAVAHRLFGSGLAVAIHDVPRPAAPRRGMAFTDAVFDGAAALEGVVARCLKSSDDLEGALTAHAFLPVLTSDFMDLVERMHPDVIVDARMRKRAQPEIQRGLVPLTVGLGPNFVAGRTTDLAVETEWGDDLGKIIAEGATRPLAGEPRSFSGHARDRFVYAPQPGTLFTPCRIGQHVESGDLVAAIDDADLHAPLSGILRGLTHDGVFVEQGTKVVEVDPRGDPAAVFGIGERPGRIADGVLSALRTWHGAGLSP
jgi:xanthine dehydrogenase accessory factor